MYKLEETEIRNQQYDNLINWAIQQSDVFTFHIPKLECEFYNMSNQTLTDFKNIEHRYNNTIDSPDYLQYRKNIEPILLRFSPYLIARYYDVNYAGSSYGYGLEIHVMNSTSQCKSLILDQKHKGLFGWLEPDLPEDLCFYAKNKCVLKSIAHEKLCFIYCNNKQISNLLYENHINFSQIESFTFDIPQLNLKF